MNSRRGQGRNEASGSNCWLPNQNPSEKSFSETWGRARQREATFAELMTAHYLISRGYVMREWDPPKTVGGKVEFIVSNGAQEFDVEVKRPDWESEIMATVPAERSPVKYEIRDIATGQVVDRKVIDGKERRERMRQEAIAEIQRRKAEGPPVASSYSTWETIRKRITDNAYAKFDSARQNVVVICDDLSVSTYADPQQVLYALYPSDSTYKGTGCFATAQYKNVGGLLTLNLLARDEVSYAAVFYPNPYAARPFTMQSVITAELPNWFTKE